MRMGTTTSLNVWTWSQWGLGDSLSSAPTAVCRSSSTMDVFFLSTIIDKLRDPILYLVFGM